MSALKKKAPAKKTPAKKPAQKKTPAKKSSPSSQSTKATAELPKFAITEEVIAKLSASATTPAPALKKKKGFFARLFGR